MSTGASNFDRREQALEVVRRRLRRLEIETHRVKAHLARLEADYEDDVADQLSRTRRRRRQSPTEVRVDPPQVAGTPNFERQAFGPNQPPFAPPTLNATTPQGAVKPFPPILESKRRGDVSTSPPVVDKASLMPGIAVDPSDTGTSARPAGQRKAQVYRQTAPPIMCSVAVHVVGLLLCLTFGFATLVQQNIPLFASPTDLAEESAIEISEVKIESMKFEDMELQNVVSVSDDFNIADNVQREFESAQLGAGSQPLGDVGQLDALPSELGTLMAGAGSPGSGTPGGEIGDAVFFGTRSQGSRFVFVVDNSSSMKDGRLEGAIAELVRSVDALSPRQAFYVIFVSDQTYPMFYPQPAADLLLATAPNKKRLAEWLPKAILASGKNRELIKAMDLAASLRPHAVYLLWDGDMRYSEKVRLEVMTHLTRPSQWSFAIHTLGMGILSLDAEYNLTAIARAHNGTYRRVDVPTTRNR